MFVNVSDAKKSCYCCKTFEEQPHTFQKCSGCKSVWYCSVQCQKTHWKIHKKDCKERGESNIKIAKRLLDLWWERFCEGSLKTLLEKNQKKGYGFHLEATLEELLHSESLKWQTCEESYLRFLVSDLWKVNIPVCPEDKTIIFVNCRYLSRSIVIYKSV